MTTTGKKNMIFGVIYFLTTLGLGMFLANKLADPEWTKAGNQLRSILRTVHAHGNLEALLNVVFGFLICRYGMNSGLSRIASVLFITGAIFHSGALYAGGLGLDIAFKLTPIGAISLVLAMVLMVPILLKGVQNEKSS